MRTIRYMGGKSSNRGTGQWICGLLDTVPEKPGRYVEPFAGMLSILLRRQPVAYEIANDLNGRITRFWRTVREQPEALSARLALTPILSETEFRAAYANLDSADDIEQAAAVFIVLQNAFRPILTDGGRYKAVQIGRSGWRFPDDLLELAERLQWVNFYDRPASEILRRFAHHTEQHRCLVYADPPYPGTAGMDDHGYGIDFDPDAFQRQILEVDAYCAVSGYADSWPLLTDAGWHVATRPVVSDMSSMKTPRVEALWTNWNPNIER